jgi:hypothetical protein
LGRGDQKYSQNNSDANFYFAVKNPDGSAIFARPAAGTFSTQNARGVVYGPGFQNHNIGLLKDFSVTERHKIQFRAEAFNWVNHPNWNNPNTTPTSASFGKVQDKSGSRELQFALRYSF